MRTNRKNIWIGCGPTFATRSAMMVQVALSKTSNPNGVIFMSSWRCSFNKTIIIRSWQVMFFVLLAQDRSWLVYCKGTGRTFLDYIRENNSVKDRKHEFITEAYGPPKEAAVRSILISALQQPCQLVYPEGCEPNVSNVIYTTGSILTPFLFLSKRIRNAHLLWMPFVQAGKLQSLLRLQRDMLNMKRKSIELMRTYYVIVLYAEWWTKFAEKEHGTQGLAQQAKQQKCWRCEKMKVTGCPLPVKRRQVSPWLPTKLWCSTSIRSTLFGWKIQLKWVTASRMNNSGMQDRSWCVICLQLILISHMQDRSWHTIF